MPPSPRFRPKISMAKTRQRALAICDRPSPCKRGRSPGSSPPPSRDRKELVRGLQKRLKTKGRPPSDEREDLSVPLFNFSHLNFQGQHYPGRWSSTILNLMRMLASIRAAIFLHSRRDDRLKIIDSIWPSAVTPWPNRARVFTRCSDTGKLSLFFFLRALTLQIGNAVATCAGGDTA